MALQFKKPTTGTPTAQTQEKNQLNLQQIPIPYMGLGVPPGIPSPFMAQPIRKKREIPPMALPGANLPRALDFYADYGGCGHWRMIWPNTLMNVNQKAIINGLTTMVIDERFYSTIKAVRLQRQATPVQLEFVKFLKHFSQRHDYKLIYEIDDIIFKDDIPDYNRCKTAFDDEKILQSSMEMMAMCDEISVTCDYMRNYYIDKTGNKNITVVPNMPPKFWMDKYDPDRIMKNYAKNKKKPRVGWVGSGTHIDVTNKTQQKDDFYHVVNNLIATRKQIQWVFIGGYPLRCKPFIDSGEMEFISWFPLINLSDAYTTTNLNAVYAPLSNCHFNRAKSNIKYLEAACCGLPGVFQNLETYSDAPLKFITGDELIDQMKCLLKDEQTYQKHSKQAREYANTMWLDDNLDMHLELYFTPFGSPDRKALLRHNPSL